MCCQGQNKTEDHTHTHTSTYTTHTLSSPAWECWPCKYCQNINVYAHTSVNSLQAPKKKNYSWHIPTQIGEERQHSHLHLHPPPPTPNYLSVPSLHIQSGPRQAQSAPLDPTSSPCDGVRQPQLSRRADWSWFFPPWAHEELDPPNAPLSLSPPRAHWSLRCPGCAACACACSSGWLTAWLTGL